MPNVLVSGCNGFIGSAAADYFCLKGYKVIGVDHRRMDKKYNYDFYCFDMDRDDLSDFYQEKKPDIYIHCAGSASVGMSITDPEQDFSKNVNVMYKTLYSLKRSGVRPKFIFLSSAAVYGNPSELPVKVNSILKPISPYGLNKKICEDICLYFIENEGFDINILRLFSVYGNGLKKQLLWDIYNKISKFGYLELFGTGEETRDFIHIKDLLDAINLIISLKSNEIIFNVANGEEIKIRSIAEKYLENLNLDKSLLKFNNYVKQGDPLNWRADITKLKSIGYNQSIDINDGIKAYVDWISNYKE